MQHSLKLILSFVALTFGMTPVLYAQGDTPVFAITYIEVKPAMTEQAIDLLKAHGEASRAAAGNLRFQILQRTGRLNQLAILDAWENVQAQDNYAAASHTRTFRNRIDPLLFSPYDERRSTPVMGTSATGGEGEVYVVTHVDNVGSGVERGTELAEELVAASRQERGAVDIGFMIQDSRRNHRTLFEVWESAADQERHTSAEHTIQFRIELLSLLGSPYDERLYHRLEN